MSNNKMSERMREDLTHIEKQSYFWGKMISYVSIATGIYALTHEGYYAIRVDTYLPGLNEDLLAYLFIIMGVIKLIGIYFDIGTLRGGGIIGLTVTWGMVTFISYMFSFGVGYPNDDFILNTFILIACFRVSYRGVFNK